MDDKELNDKYNIVRNKRPDYRTAEDLVVMDMYMKRAGEEAKKEIDNENV